MKSLIPILLPVVLIFTAFIPAKNTSIKDFEWLIGRWENQSNNYSYSEEWIKVNSNELSGKRMFIRNNDTLYYNTMLLTKKDSIIYYYEDELVPSKKTKKLSPPYTIITSPYRTLTIENPGLDAMHTLSCPTPDSLVINLTGDVFRLKKVSP